MGPSRRSPNGTGCTDSPRSTGSSVSALTADFPFSVFSFSLRPFPSPLLPLSFSAGRLRWYADSRRSERMNPKSAENSADVPAPECATQTGIPPSRRQRDRLADAARARVARVSAVPPLTLAELEAHARAVVAEAGLDESYVPYAAVLVHNEAWRDALAAVPFDRRLLLLPQCLRDADACPAVFDGLGLLCRRCGRCAIDELLAEAERLGYVALVSEGTGAVTAMIESGQIEAFVGASCLSSLQEIFPRIEAAGVPGVAIPLLRDGCRNTALDLDRLLEAMRLRRDGLPRPPAIEPIRREVEGWFTPAVLDELLGPARDTTERIARDWLLRAGKRW
ncbi:MAG TPA: hypothetical protein DCX07_04695, partial [Phycisphaerales bacterium]|nr:hypothetical protein [Phycisphaerales bacterium]